MNPSGAVCAVLSSITVPWKTVPSDSTGQRSDRNGERGDVCSVVPRDARLGSLAIFSAQRPHKKAPRAGSTISRAFSRLLAKFHLTVKFQPFRSHCL